MKKRVLGILLASVLTLALAGCAGDSNTESNSTDSNTTSQVEQSESSDTTSDTMDEASYMEKVNALPDAATDFSNAMGEFMSTADQQDLDTLLAQLEDLRSYEQPLYDFAAIDNPPEKYAEAHERLANSCTQMGDVLDEYVDFMKGVFEGTVSQDDSQALVDKMTEASNEVAQAGQALTAIE